jgi:hypothetical protein
MVGISKSSARIVYCIKMLNYTRVPQNTLLYRIRTDDAKHPPPFTRPVWFVDDPFYLFVLTNYLHSGREDGLSIKKFAKTKVVDIYKTKIFLNLIHLKQAHLSSGEYNYLMLESFISDKDPSYRPSFTRMSDDKLIVGDNHIPANWLAINAPPTVDGWYEENQESPGKYSNLMNEIMLLPQASKKVAFVQSTSVDDILSKILI